MVGNIVCKADTKDGVYRGFVTIATFKCDRRCWFMIRYIAMLAVEKSFRKHGIGSALAQKAIDRMHELGCDEVPQILVDNVTVRCVTLLHSIVHL